MGRVVDTKRILAALGVAAPPDALLRFIERRLGIAEFERLCAGANVRADNADVRGQIADVFAAAGISWEVAGSGASADLSRAGSLVFYANHPYGFADALLALSLALARRPDTKVLANGALAGFDFHAAHTIWVDIASGAGRMSTNRRGLREAVQHLRGGGALLIFPSQLCSHLTLPACRVTDPPWSPHLASLIDLAHAACVPLYFEGRNSWRFQLMGLIHPAFRTLLLLREFVRLRGRTIQVRIGALKPFSAADAQERPKERLKRLREGVYALRDDAAQRMNAG
ncbi:MAG TPA: hypothetical protein VMN79_10715 [Casimicrobiaceae bacterium]|nr:hypothetical protein [Casimicrobiaceae bacterium]